MRRRDRMRTRQPGVQRHEPRLRAEADERGDRDKRLRAASGLRQRRRVADCAVVGKRQQRDPHAGAAQMRDRQVGEDRRPDRPISPRRDDRGGGHERHQLPEGEERRDVAGGQQPGQREQERRGQRADRTWRRADPEVRARKDKRRHRRDRQDQQEEPAERVQPNRRSDVAAEGRADRVTADQHGGATRTQQGRSDRLRGEPDSEPTGPGRHQATERQRRHASERDHLDHAHVSGRTVFATARAAGLFSSSLRRSMSR